MSKIVDPKLDGLFRNGPTEQPPVQIAAPLNDAQLVSMVAARMAESGQPLDVTVARAVEVVARSVAAVTTGKLKAKIDEEISHARALYAGNGATQLPTQ